jgi:hypothetical protein
MHQLDCLSASVSWADSLIQNSLALVGQRQVEQAQLLGKPQLTLAQFKDYLRNLFIEVRKCGDPEAVAFISAARGALLKMDLVQELHDILITPGRQLDDTVLAKSVQLVCNCHCHSNDGQQPGFDLTDALVMASNLACDTLEALAQHSLRHGLSPRAYDREELSERIYHILETLQKPISPVESTSEYVPNDIIGLDENKDH